jgi:hypothetical protein
MTILEFASSRLTVRSRKSLPAYTYKYTDVTTYKQAEVCAITFGGTSHDVLIGHAADQPRMFGNQKRFGLVTLY